MHTITQKAAAATISQVPPERESSQAAVEPAIWSQKHITQLPPEVLSHIFGCLGCDDIAQVRGTCRPFRDLVQAEHAEAFFYRQLPKRFRKQYLQSRLWQKRLVKNGLHPFTTKVLGKETRFISTEQQAALLCFHTLRKMMHTCRYQPKNVFADLCSTDSLLVDFSLNGSALLLYDTSDKRVRVLDQSESDSWSQQEVDLEGRSVLSAGMSCSTNRHCFPAFGSQNVIDFLRRDRDQNRWQLIDQQWVNTGHKHKISPSGKYLVIYTRGIKGIRCSDDQGKWVLMPMADSARIDFNIQELQFCPSEQHLAIKNRQELVILSLDSQGCWNLSWLTTTYRCISYVEFCPSGSWLLVACALLDPDVIRSPIEMMESDKGLVDMIKFDPRGEWQHWRRISPEYLRLTFSPAGNYLVGQRMGKNYPLWQLLKSGEWVSCGSLADPEASPLPALEQMGINLFKFSPDDNYLLTSSRGGMVKIRGQDEQGHWMVRGSLQHESTVKFVEFSVSGIHALTVDQSSVRIWGLDDDGLWLVKGKIPVNGLICANFHPVAEHLVVIVKRRGIAIWEIRKDDASGMAIRGGTII